MNNQPLRVSKEDHGPSGLRSWVYANGQKPHCLILDGTQIKPSVLWLLAYSKGEGHIDCESNFRPPPLTLNRLGHFDA